MKNIAIATLISILAMGTATAGYQDDVNNYIIPGANTNSSSTDFTRMPATAAGRKEGGDSKSDEVERQLHVPEHG